jgi:CheY-like chemotaxis protein
MSKPTRVLLAEADSISTQLLSFTLEREGFEVLKARGGLDALRLAQEQQVDLVLSEVLLDDMDGLELCRRLRAGWNTQRIPIVLVTSLGSSDERISGLMAGADDYLIKPYDVRELTIRLNHLLNTYSNCYQLHPLTKLPGGQLIEAYVDNACKGTKPWALLHIDIKQFGSYNRIYGFDAGDILLKHTASLLRQVILGEVGERSDSRSDGGGDDEEPLFLGHEGRDDFIAVVGAGRVSALCDEIVARFDEQAPGFYPASQRESSYQVLIDRKGNTHLVPPVALSIGVVTGALCDHLSYLELREAASSVLQRARMEEHSAAFTNRRHLVGRITPGATADERRA